MTAIQNVTPKKTTQSLATRKNKKAMIQALEKSLGIVSHACQLVGIERMTHYRWLKDDPNYKSKVEDLDNVVLDFVETRLHRLIADGDTTATIFFLKTKAQGRGYIEKYQFDMAQVPTIEIIDSGTISIDTDIQTQQSERQEDPA